MSSIILGIDPGLAIVGFGVLRQDDLDSKTPMAYGVIRTPSDTPTADRLLHIYEEFLMIIEKFQPDLVAVEKLFFGKNAKTAMLVGQARGIILLGAVQKGLLLEEYTPLQIKQALTGYGRADKRQMQLMVQKVLNLDKIPKPDDAADALAVALTASMTTKVLEKL